MTDQSADLAAAAINRGRILKEVIVPGDRAAVLRKLDGYDLDGRRAIIDVLLTVTVLPGQARGQLRTDRLPITTCTEIHCCTTGFGSLV
jgi:hypothetical protein